MAATRRPSGPGATATVHAHWTPRPPGTGTLAGRRSSVEAAQGVSTGRPNPRNREENEVAQPRTAPLYSGVPLDKYTRCAVTAHFLVATFVEGFPWWHREAGKTDVTARLPHEQLSPLSRCSRSSLPRRPGASPVHRTQHRSRPRADRARPIMTGLHPPPCRSHSRSGQPCRPHVWRMLWISAAAPAGARPELEEEPW